MMMVYTLWVRFQEAHQITHRIRIQNVDAYEKRNAQNQKNTASSLSAAAAVSRSSIGTNKKKKKIKVKIRVDYSQKYTPGPVNSSNQKLRVWGGYY